MRKVMNYVELLGRNNLLPSRFLIFFYPLHKDIFLTQWMKVKQKPRDGFFESILVNLYFVRIG